MARGIKNKATREQEERRRNYLALKGLRCPFCNSDNLDSSMMCTDDNAAAYQEVHCCKCGKDWTDIYTLTDVTFQDTPTTQSNIQKE